MAGRVPGPSFLTVIASSRIHDTTNNNIEEENGTIKRVSAFYCPICLCTIMEAGTGLCLLKWAILPATSFSALQLYELLRILHQVLISDGI